MGQYDDEREIERYGRGGRYGEPGDGDEMMERRGRSGRENHFAPEYEHGRYGQPAGYEYGDDVERARLGRSYDRAEPQGRSVARDRYGRGFDLEDGRADYVQGRETWRQPGPYAGRGPRGYQRSDERIRDEACERLTLHGQVDATDIDVQVADGEITLEGMVDSRQAKRLAEAALETILGVRDIHNRLRIRERTGRDWQAARGRYRQEWARRYGQTGRRWEEVEPAYHYGFEMAGVARYRGRPWSEVEPELRAGYAGWARDHGYRVDAGGWEELWEEVRQAWHETTPDEVS